MGRQASGRQFPDVDLVQSFDTACRAAGLTHDQVARMMDITPDHLYLQLRQQRHLSLLRLLRLRDEADGRKFLRAYWPLVGAEMGLTELADAIDVATALQRFIDAVQVRMVKSELHTRELGEDDGQKTA